MVFVEERLISTIRGTGGSEMKRGFCLVLSSFGAGKTASKFHNSLKNSRDRFDSWLTNVRVDKSALSGVKGMNESADGAMNLVKTSNGWKAN